MVGRKRGKGGGICGEECVLSLKKEEGDGGGSFFYQEGGGGRGQRLSLLGKEIHRFP